MTASDLLVPNSDRSARPGRRIAAAVAVGALGAASVALLMPAPAGAGEVPAPGPVRAEDADGSDVYTAPPTAANPPNGEFGATKVSAEVLPVAGTYSGPANLSGGTFTLTPESGGPALATCTTDISGKCFFFTHGSFEFKGDQRYVLRQTAAPAGFFLNPTEVLVGRCVDVDAPDANACGPIQTEPDRGTTDNQFTFANVGTARPVAGTVSSTVYPLAGVPGGPGAPDFVSGLIAGATFELRATADGPALASATSGADGAFAFPGVFAPGDYYVVQSGAAAGYVPSAPIPVSVPAPPNAAAAQASAGMPVQVAVENPPNIAAPLLAPDATTVTIGSPMVVRDVLANDQLYGADAYILAASAVHGSVAVGDAPGCTLPAGQCLQVVRYLADPAYLGIDVVTYSVATRGGLSSSTDTITVVAVPVVTPPTVVPVAAPAVPLAKTGAEHAAGGAVYGAGLLLLGAALTAAGARRRARV